MQSQLHCNMTSNPVMPAMLTHILYMVNVEKCGLMHFRRKGVKRSDERFHVGGKEIKRDSNMQQSCKHFWLRWMHV